MNKATFAFFVTLLIASTGVFSEKVVADEKTRTANQNSLKAKSGKPNVLFIISDDLSAETLKCYGNRQCETPNIDKLANRSLMFERAYCQYPVCGPSRAALMSGLYPPSIGVMGNGSSKRFTEVLNKRPSMSQLFKNNGYYAARVSKIYHMRVPGDITAGVDGPDHAASWTEKFNCQAPEWYTKGEHEHLTKEKLKFARDKHYNLGFGGAFYVVKGESDGAEQADVKAANKAIELLEKHNDESFFLAVGLVRPHVPIGAPKHFYDPYPPEKMKLPKKVENDWDDIPKQGISKNSKGAGLTNLEKQKKVTAAYYASVAFMDAQVGKILDALDRLKLRDNTIVVFTADHGYHMGEHDFWQKMSLHEESTRIPILLSGPGIESGKTKSLAQQIDIYPTLAELAGLPIPEHIQGKSLVPVTKDNSAKVHDSILCFRRKRDKLLRTERFALIKYGGTKEMELYDMEKDPLQFTNLAKNKSYAQTLIELNMQLEQRMRAIPTR